MSRNRIVKEPLKTSAHEAVSKEERTDESTIRQVPREEGPRTLRTGYPLAGSEVLEAVGSNGAVGRAMHDVLYAPDDEKVMTRLGPEQEASVAFRTDEELGDAGAEFAEEFGRDFLMAATAGEDFSEIYDEAASQPSSPEEAYLQEVGMSELEDLTDYAEPIEDEPPSR